MWRWLVMVAALALLVGCGEGSGVEDPFVGTWADPARPDLGLTISKQGDDYVAVAYRDGAEDLRLVLARDADDGTRLTAVELPEGFSDRPGARYDPASGHLQYTPFGMNVDLRRTSSTAP